MAINYASLKIEIQSDPRAYGYAQHVASGADNSLADLLNLPRTTISVRRIDIAREELLGVFDIRDFAATPAGVNNQTLAASWFESVAQADRVVLANPDGSASVARANLNRLIVDTNGSQTRLNALSKRDGSRAEELFGTGTVVSADDVAKALRG